VALDDAAASRHAAAWTVRAVDWLNTYGRAAVSLLILLLAVGWSWLAGACCPPRFARCGSSPAYCWRRWPGLSS
jgi:hypothetical protein